MEVARRNSNVHSRTCHNDGNDKSVVTQKQKTNEKSFNINIIIIIIIIKHIYRAHFRRMPQMR